MLSQAFISEGTELLLPYPCLALTAIALSRLSPRNNPKRHPSKFSELKLLPEPFVATILYSQDNKDQSPLQIYLTPFFPL